MDKQIEDWIKAAGNKITILPYQGPEEPKQSVRLSKRNRSIKGKYK